MQEQKWPEGRPPWLVGGMEKGGEGSEKRLRREEGSKFDYPCCELGKAMPRGGGEKKGGEGGGGTHRAHTHTGNKIPVRPPPPPPPIKKAADAPQGHQI